MKNIIRTVVVAFLFIFIATPMLASPVYGSTVSEIQDGVKKVDKDSGSAASGTARVKEIFSIAANVLLFLIGSFAVIMIIISGLRLVTANGDANTVTQAKNIIIYSVIGIVVAVSAYAIVTFILGVL